MRHSIITIMAFMAIAGSLFIIQTADRTVKAEDNETLALMWDQLNLTRNDIATINSKLNALTYSVDFIKQRLGYNITDPSTFTLKNDLTKVLASLYNENGTNRIEVINGNQLVLADMNDQTYNEVEKVLLQGNETQSSVDANTVKIGSFDFNITLLLIIGLVTIMMIVFFLVIFVRQGKGSVREYRGHNESLFMSPPPPSPQKPAYSQKEYEEAAAGVDAMPDCFRIQFDPSAVECKTCGVWRECSGEPVKRHTAKITQRPPEKQHIAKPPQRSRYVKQ